MKSRLSLSLLLALGSAPGPAVAQGPAEAAWVLPPSGAAWDLGFVPHQGPEAGPGPQAGFWFPWTEWSRSASPAELHLGPALVRQGLPRKAPLLLRWEAERLIFLGEVRAEAWARLEKAAWLAAWAAGPPLETPWGPARPVALAVEDDRPGTAWLAPGQGLLRWEAVDPKGLAVLTRSPHQEWP